MASTQDAFGSVQETASRGSAIGVLLLSWVVLYIVAYPIYAIYLHPLKDYPGGTLQKLSRLPYWIATIRGRQPHWMHEQHQKYGPTIRFGPNDISFTDAQAWKDIYAPKNRRENGKTQSYHPPSANGDPNIITIVSPERHAKVRRTLAPAFAEQSLRKQEPMFQYYANMMIERGRKKVNVNMAELLNFTTFDVMAEFAFGESLGLLKNDAYSEWLSTVFNVVLVLPVIQFIRYYWVTEMLWTYFEPNKVRQLRLGHFDHTVTRVEKRLKEGSSKPDLWNLVEESDALTMNEKNNNAELFMTAGSETTASLLTGLTYYLLKSPEKFEILKSEVRDTFKCNADITFEALTRMEYLNACIKEGLRVYPPVPTAIPREVAPEGAVISGKFVPAGTEVWVYQTATYRSPLNFKNPDAFVPERWLGDPEYKDDEREAHQPFGYGPRNCLGMNMAWHEMRLLLAKLVFNFDCVGDIDDSWRDQNAYVIWDRKPLPVVLKDLGKQ
ncbi:cytochrome P450 [Astrocystis sublimbata]|nr:cytochrome P450 [Astrocystis sublimbata]